MAKYAEFNRKDLTPIQIQERAKQHMLAKRYRGMSPKLSGLGLNPSTSTEPIFKPIPLPGPPSPLELMTHLLMVFPWMRRRRREAELWQKQEAQSLKDKGVT